MQQDKEKGRGWWARLRRPSARYSVLTLLGLGMVAGIVMMSGFLTELKATASEKFCISCHEMRVHSYAEYKESTHYYNASGVRASCTDCHLAAELGPMAMRKIKAVKEVFHHFKGTIDSREEFENRRLVMAKRVWAEMAANDSRECRSCHGAGTMDYAKQSLRARKQHIRGDDEKLTCIECHKGIAHALPEMEEIDPTLVIARQ